MRSSSWPGWDDGDADAMAGRFRLFGERWFAESSPLYTQLSLAVADDPEIAAMLLAAPVDQRSPTLFFAAVHFLVMRSPDEPLAVHFPDVSSLPPAPDGAYPMLRELCLRRSEELGGLIASRHTQTNEVGRCSFLLPALEVISSAVERRPLALVEVGCSAGLNLLMDRYPGHKQGVRPQDDMIKPEDVAGAVRWLLTTSPPCVVPEIQFTRPGDNE